MIDIWSSDADALVAEYERDLQRRAGDAAFRLRHAKHDTDRQRDKLANLQRRRPRTQHERHANAIAHVTRRIEKLEALQREAEIALGLVLIEATKALG